MEYSPRFRLLPTTRQREQLGWQKNTVRQVYNHALYRLDQLPEREDDCDVIVFEDLTDIREQLPHADWHHIWAFRRLVEYVEYKAPERGVAVEQVEPNHTSQRCSRTDCGFTHEDNREGEQFKCQKCGYEVNADYNGAKNIGLRYMRKRTHSLRSSPTSGSVDVLENEVFQWSGNLRFPSTPVDVRINGGTVNGNGYHSVDS